MSSGFIHHQIRVKLLKKKKIYKLIFYLLKKSQSQISADVHMLLVAFDCFSKNEVLEKQWNHFHQNDTFLLMWNIKFSKSCFSLLEHTNIIFFYAKKISFSCSKKSTWDLWILTNCMCCEDHTQPMRYNKRQKDLQDKKKHVIPNWE